MKLVSTIVAVPLMLASSFAMAQSRCDCSEVVGACTARITEVPQHAVGTRFHVQASTQHCAIVEYTIDGMNGQVTIWDDGEDISQISSRKPGGQLAVRSCRVCRDRLAEKEESQEHAADQPPQRQSAPRFDPTHMAATCVDPETGARTSIVISIPPNATQEQKTAAARHACGVD